MNQIEFLLRLSEDARDDGNDMARRHHDERDVHGKKLQELWGMIEQARQNVWTELVRFGIVNEEKAKAQIAHPNPQQGPRAVRQAEEKADANGAGTRDVARR